MCKAACFIYICLLCEVGFILLINEETILKLSVVNALPQVVHPVRAESGFDSIPVWLWLHYGGSGTTQGSFVCFCFYGV